MATQGVPPGGVYFITETGQQGIYYDFRGSRFVYYFHGNDTIAATGGLGAPRRVTGSSLRGAQEAPIQELWGIASGSPGKTFQQHGEGLLLILLGGNQAAMADPDVVKLAMQVASGQIGENEFRVRLQQTAYFQNQTNIQRDWGTLSAAEQQQRIAAESAELAQLWFRNTGTQLSFNDPRIRDWATRIVSGTYTRGQWLMEAVFPEALKNPESPHARMIRDEVEGQLQRGVDIENKAQEVADLFDRWGIPVSPSTAKDWANKIIANQASDADLLQNLQKQAQILYPWKDPQTDTQTAAQPWLQTYARVLERSVPDLRDPDVQRALAAGQPIYEFEQELKMKPEWMKTKNAMESTTAAASQVGRMMGFV